jgi:hypothetical protein
MSGRDRILAAILAAASIALAGSLLELSLGPRRYQQSAAGEDVTGAWFCPHGGGEGWRAWIVLANPSPKHAEILVTTYSRGALPTATRTNLLAGRERFIEVPAARMASASVVEFFGASTSAGIVVERAGGEGIAAEPCSSRTGRRWYVAEGTSERGQQAMLVILNPYAVDAIFDVVLAGMDRVVRAGALQGVLLPARQATAVNLNRFALGEPTLAAAVLVSSGRVAVSGFGLGESGFRSVRATAAAARTWFLPGAADDAPSALAVLAPDGEVPLEVRVQGAENQVDALTDAAVGAGRAMTFEVLALQSGLAVEAEGPGAFVAGRRLSVSTAGDQAATAGAPRGAVAWVAPPALGPGGGQSLLVLQNSGAEAAAGDISFLTLQGRTEAPQLATFSVEGGRTQVLDLSSVSGGQPVTALVKGDSPGLLVAQASLSPAGYAVAMGTPIDQLRMT